MDQIIAAATADRSHSGWSDQAATRSAGVVNSDAEDLLCRLSVTVDAFKMEAVEVDAALTFPAIDRAAVLFVLDGTGTLEWSDRTAAVGTSTLAIVPAGQAVRLCGPGDCAAAADTPFAWQPLSQVARVTPGGSTDTITVVSAAVSASAGHRLGLFEGLDGLLIQCGEGAGTKPLFDLILAEMADPGVGSKAIVEALFKHVLIVLLRRKLVPQDAATPLFMTLASPQMRHVVNLINASSAERLPIAQLARAAGMTTIGLSREFERVFGESVTDYIQGVRLEQAADLLRRTSLPVKAIAASVGYASRSHFSRTFAKRRGEDPTAFRRTQAAL
jgi:AraC family transcriptional regulator, activator of mtrCDE